MRSQIKYADHEGHAARFTDSEAWVLVGFNWPKWTPINPAEILSYSKELSEADFKKRFPKVPRLPRKAFAPRLSVVGTVKRTCR